MNARNWGVYAQDSANDSPARDAVLLGFVYARTHAQAFETARVVYRHASEACKKRYLTVAPVEIKAANSNG